MDVYVDEDYYKTDYEGALVPDGSFNKFSKRATDAVNSLTSYKIVELGGLSALTDGVQELVKKATCAQIEYYVVQGINADIGTAKSSRQFSTSKFSMGASNTDVSREAQRYSPAMISYLEDAGLFNSGGVHIGYI